MDTSRAPTERHRYELTDFGLDVDRVRERFARYLATYDAGA